MIGRLYTWRGEVWEVVARWRTPTPGETRCWTRRRGHFDEYVLSPRCPGPGWRVRPVVRNVLIERVVVADSRAPYGVVRYRRTGERTVRPFRGLRRVRAT